MELTVAAFLAYLPPTVGLDEGDKFSDFHWIRMSTALKDEKSNERSSNCHLVFQCRKNAVSRVI